VLYENNHPTHRGKMIVVKVTEYFIGSCTLMVSIVEAVINNNNNSILLLLLLLLFLYYTIY